MDTNCYTPEGRVLADLTAEMFRIQDLLSLAGDRLTKTTSLTIARFMVLYTLRKEPGTVAHTARLMGIRRQSAQRTVDLLAELGLVTFEPNTHHRRAMLVRLTEAGRKALDQALLVHAEWINDLAVGLELEELQCAKRLLEELHRRLHMQERGEGLPPRNL